MDWVTATWSVMAGGCLMLGLLHLVIWCRDRSSWANWWFFVAALGVVGLMACEVVTMHARVPEVYVAGLRYGHLVYLFGVVGIVGFVHCNFGTGRRWLLWLAVALRAAAVVANFTTGQSLHVTKVLGLGQMDFLGETVTILDKWEPNRWVLLGQTASLVLVAYIVDASLRLWRTGTREGRGRVMTVGVSLVFFIIAASVQTGLVAVGGWKMPFLVSLPFLGIALAMGWELSHEVLRVGTLFHQMKRSEQQLTLAAAAGNMSVWEWDIVADRIWVNGAGRMLYGVENAEKIDFKRFVSTIHAPDQAGMRLAVEAALAGPERYASDYRVDLPDGSIRWMAARGLVERDAQGRPCLLRGVSMDITERKESEERIRQVIEAAPNAMVMADSVGRIVLVNAQTEAVFGYGRDELLNKSIEILLPDYLREDHPAMRQGYHAHPSARAMGAGRELFGKRKDGSEVPVEIGLSPVQTTEGTFVLASIIDITGRKQAERESARQQQELAHLSRISILGELAGALAHELNQPLAAILGNAQVGRGSLRIAPPDLTEMAAILDDIADDAKRAGGIIHGMRAMFKKGSIAEPVPMDLNETITQVLHLLHSEIVGRKVSLETNLAEDLPQVGAGRVEVQQVFINLVINALDAMTGMLPGGRLEITTRHEGGHVRVCVRDSGPGIAEDMMERLFESFVSTKSGGLGLGLAISRDIVERFHGELRADNHPAGGAVFHLSLPVTAPG